MNAVIRRCAEIAKMDDTERANAFTQYINSLSGNDQLGLTHFLEQNWLIYNPGVGAQYLGYKVVLKDGRRTAVRPDGVVFAQF